MIPPIHEHHQSKTVPLFINITNCHLPILLTSLKINLFVNITNTMQSYSLTSLKRVIETHLSPKKANRFASPHTGYPITSPKNGQFHLHHQIPMYIVYQHHQKDTHSKLAPTSNPFWVACWCCVTFLFLFSFIVIHHVLKCTPIALSLFLFLKGTLHALVILWASCFSGCSIWWAVPHSCIFRC